jgi:serine/threonine-protein kinase
LQGGEQTFGDRRYIVRRELGRGSMGVVYEAEDVLLARTVAVKTIELAFDPGGAAGSDFERRFFTEARVAARLSHPGIVVCHDVGKDTATGKLFIVFEYLKGRTLADRAAEGPMPWREALQVVVRVARAIHHAHEHGVVHRDLKPANVMLLDPGPGGAAAARAEAAVKIMDFGVARLESLGQRLTRTGQSFGSPLYMSPEQALGEGSSARSDIFSLGSVLCTLLLGWPWFDAPSLPEIVGRVVHADPPHLSGLRRDVPASLDSVMAMALAKSADARYATAADMADDLDDILAGRVPRHAGAVASPPGRAPAEDGVLAGLAGPAGDRPGAPAHDPLASLLEEPPVAETAVLPVTAAGAPGARTTPAGASTAVEARASTAVPTGPPRRRPAVAGAMLVLAVLAFGAFALWRRASVPDPSPPPRGPIVAGERSASVAERAPVPPAAAAPTAAAPTVPTTAPTASTTTAPTEPTVAPTAPTTTPPAARPRPQAARKVEPIIESPPIGAPATGEGAPASSSGEAARTRIRLSVEHPFENGRLIVWIDGVLVYETKLQASASRRIVAFKVREGRAEKVLDVEPGRHEVRVEVTWEQNRRLGRKVVDVAPGSTGLLEVRVGRMSKDLSLAWSRLTKD